MSICSFLVWKKRVFDLEGDLVRVPHTWYLSAQSFIRLLKLVWKNKILAGSISLIFLRGVPVNHNCYLVRSQWNNQVVLHNLLASMARVISCLLSKHECAVDFFRHIKCVFTWNSKAEMGGWLARIHLPSPKKERKTFGSWLTYRSFHSIGLTRGLARGNVPGIAGPCWILSKHMPTQWPSNRWCSQHNSNMQTSAGLLMLKLWLLPTT